VFALLTMLSGTALLIVMVPDGTSGRWLLFSGALLLAGLGGGAVISPNFTLTLENVPTRMAGAAGGALQTGQRIGTAIGTALLMAAYRNALAAEFSAQTALRLSVGLALVLLTGALVLAVRDMAKR
jgi:MFS family permease